MKPDKFQNFIWDFYGESARADLPWRQTSDPYAIYISEMMLQQTQATRVIPKYEDWLKTFPNFKAVAEAPKSEILRMWQGLGYNRRALFVKRTCETVIREHGSTLPESETKLLKLPGIGPYTAGALQAFVFSKPVFFVETNIRTVFIHHFFSGDENITDSQIKDKVKDTLPERNIREWYWALMDYGNHLKSEIGNLNKQSKSYQTQSKFAGSNRQLRAEITRFVLENEPVKRDKVLAQFKKLTEENERMRSVAANLEKLQAEGFLSCDENLITTAK